MKKCPFCAEEIQDEAIKCRFCQEYLKKKWWKNCFFGCLTIFIVSIVSLILVIWFSLFMTKLLIYKLFFTHPKFPQYNFPLFTPPGLEYMLRDLTEFLRSLWDRALDLFNLGRVI